MTPPKFFARDPGVFVARLGGPPLLAGNRAHMVERTNELFKDVVRNPFVGIGKPEPLKHEIKGYWSRRIDRKHRLVYRVTADTIPDCPSAPIP